LGTGLPEGWALKETSSRDLWHLKRFYRNRSGGLLLDALNVDEMSAQREDLEEIYSDLGFLRRCRLYALKNGDQLKAVLMVNQSDLGLNLSELLNGITVLVTNPAELSWNILSTAIAQFTSLFNMEKVPILFYPSEYVRERDIPFEKHYQLWILNVNYGNEYLEYMNKRFRISYQ
jgi:hypothetical protein